ncbi:MAG: hypothetical protein V3T31_12715 [candidate division Zixibacteria bacterium]
MITIAPDFIERTLKTFTLVLLIFVPFGLYYIGFYPTLAILSGAVWGIINLLLLSRLIRSTLKPDGIESIRPILPLFVLFPLLFVAGYYLLTFELFEPWHLLAGFTSLFAVMFLKALGRVITKADKEENGGKEAVV